MFISIHFRITFLSLLVLLITSLLPATSSAQSGGMCPTGVEPQVDFDGDCVDDNLEREGYNSSLEACTPSPTATDCFVTDPTAWSSDGDPYSDFQEATNVNMDDTVNPPFNGPLVAAAPKIEIEMVQYRFTPTGDITDSSGETISSSDEQEFNVSGTASVSYTVGTEAMASLTGASVSASTEVTTSLSVTAGYSSTRTEGTALNWESATTTNSAHAANLRLDIRARNVGSATADNIKPTFNLFIGEEQIATFTLDESFPDNLSGGEASEVITVPLLNEPSIPLALDELVSLQEGAPLRIVLIGLEADVIRWRPEDSSWSCDPCTWENFQDQIEARTLRLMVDFGYSGDPNAEIPRELTGTPFEYRVFTGTNTAPVNLEKALRLVGYTVDTQTSEAVIQGRPYSQWYFTSGPETSGISRDSTFLDYYDEAGRPDNILELDIPSGTSLLMVSPDPLDAGPIVTSALLDHSMRGVEVIASAKGSIPVAGGEAYFYSADGRLRVDTLAVRDNTGFFGSDSLVFPVSIDSSYVIMRDVLGNGRRFDDLAISVPIATDCSIFQDAYLDFLREPTFAPGKGVFTLFLDGDPNKPVTAYCFNSNGDFDVWYPQTNDMVLDDVLGIDVIDRERRVAVGEGAILYSGDGGQSWKRTELSSDIQDNTFRGVSFRERSDVGIAVGDNSVIMRSEDGGQTWTRVTVNGSTINYDAVDYAGNDTWYAAGGNSVLRSEDNGLTWDPLVITACDENGENCSAVAGFANLTTVSFGSEMVGMIGDHQMADGLGRAFSTLDGGATWFEEPLITDVNDLLNDVTHNGDNTWYVATFDKVIRIDVDGARADSIVFQTPNVTELRGVSFPTPDIGYAVYIGGVVVRTGDGGITWRSPYGGYPTPSHPGANFMTDIDMLDANVGAVTGTDGVIGATDSGGGVFVTNPSVLVRTSIEEEPVTELPQTIELDQNYPNPFNPTTSIAFSLSQGEDVRLDVFDVLGRRVATLVDDFKPAGRYTVTFTAEGLASGMYMYRLQSESSQILRKMVLLQ